MEGKDVDDETSGTIIAWSCATREVLTRIVEGTDSNYVSTPSSVHKDGGGAYVTADL